MLEYLEINIFLLNVPLQIAKYTPRGACIPGWEPLV